MGTNIGGRRPLATVTLAIAVGALAACSSSPKEELLESPELAEAQPGTFDLIESDRGPMLTLDDVLFDFEEATLRPEADEIVRRTAKYLYQNPSRVAFIEGHTDRVGEEDYNLWLSRLRAETVADELIDLGVKPSRIRVGGFGETRPVASNDTAAGRQANRRVEIVFERAGGGDI